MRNAWQVVVIVVTAITGVTLTEMFGRPSMAVITVIGSLVVPSVTILLMGHGIQGSVDEVRQQVNGRMSELIANQHPPAPAPPEGPQAHTRVTDHLDYPGS